MSTRRGTGDGADGEALAGGTAETIGGGVGGTAEGGVKAGGSSLS